MSEITQRKINVENQVCTLAQSEIFFQLGVVQKALWFWQRGQLVPWFDVNSQAEHFAAYTGDELDQLFLELNSRSFHTYYSGRHRQGGFYAKKSPNGMVKVKPTPAQAKAELLIFLMRKRELPIEEANSNLLKFLFR